VAFATGGAERGAPRPGLGGRSWGSGAGGAASPPAPLSVPRVRGGSRSAPPAATAKTLLGASRRTGVGRGSSSRTCRRRRQYFFAHAAQRQKTVRPRCLEQKNRSRLRDQFSIRPSSGDASVAMRLNKLDSPGSARRAPRLRYKFHSVHAPIQELCAPGLRSALDSPLPGGIGDFTPCVP